MLAYTYIEKGKFALVEKPKPVLIEPTDAIVRVTMGSICSSDLHIKHGSVPRAVSGITVGHEMVGVVEEIGYEVTNVKPGDRVTVNVETFCGECITESHNIHKFTLDVTYVQKGVQLVTKVCYYLEFSYIYKHLIINKKALCLIAEGCTSVCV